MKKLKTIRRKKNQDPIKVGPFVCNTEYYNDRTERRYCGHRRELHIFAGGCLVAGCACDGYDQTLQLKEQEVEANALHRVAGSTGE